MQNFDFLVSYTDCSLVLKRVWTREFRWVTGQCYSPASTLVSSFDPGFVSSFKGFSHTRPLLFLMPSPSLPLLLCNLARNLLVTCGTKKKKKKNLYLHLLVYYKGYNSGTAKWRRCTGQGKGEWGAAVPSQTPQLLVSECVLPGSSSEVHIPSLRCRLPCPDARAWWVGAPNSGSGLTGHILRFSRRPHLSHHIGTL